MPASPPLRRPVPRAFLEQVSRAILCRLVAHHRPALAHHPEFSYEALAASAQIDRAQVDVLWNLLSDPPLSLVRLQEELLAIADVATPSGHEALLRRDVKRLLDHDKGAEDCAALAFLDHRALFDEVRPRVGTNQTRVFATLQSEQARSLPTDPRNAADFAQKMSAALEARGRTDHFKAHEWQSGFEHHFELVFGRLAQSRDLLGRTVPDAAHGVTAQVTDRSTERAHAVFHDDTLRLDLAGPDWIKEIVRRVFGAAYFGREDHFAGKETVNLEPLRDTGAALSVSEVHDLRKVDLQEVTVVLGDGSGTVTIAAPADATRSAAGRYVALALQEGTPTRAVFLLSTRFKVRPVKVTLVCPGKIEFGRSDPRVIGVVRDWMVARGFMALPASASAPSHDGAARAAAPPHDGAASTSPHGGAQDG